MPRVVELLGHLLLSTLPPPTTYPLDWEKTPPLAGGVFLMII